MKRYESWGRTLHFAFICFILLARGDEKVYKEAEICFSQTHKTLGIYRLFSRWQRFLKLFAQIRYELMFLL